MGGGVGGTVSGPTAKLTSLLLRGCSLGEVGVATISSLCAVSPYPPIYCNGARGCVNSATQ